MVASWHLTETHEGEYLGQAERGDKATLGCMSIDRIENGMVVLEFGAWDSPRFREQLGLTHNHPYILGRKHIW